MLYEFKIKHDNYEKTVVDTEKCVHCGYCTFACRDGVYEYDKEQNLIVVGNPNSCSSCNECACPFGAREFIPFNEEVSNAAYALIGTQEYVR